MNVLEHNKIKKKALLEVRNVGFKAIKEAKICTILFYCL